MHIAHIQEDKYLAGTCSKFSLNFDENSKTKIYTCQRPTVTVTAKDFKLVSEAAAGLDPWTAGPVKLKEALQRNQLVSTPPQDAWKLPYLRSLLRQLQEAKYLVQEDRVKQTQNLIDSLVI